MGGHLRAVPPSYKYLTGFALAGCSCAVALPCVYEEAFRLTSQVDGIVAVATANNETTQNLP
jgi:hypothetical protein